MKVAGNGIDVRLIILDTNIHDTGLHEAASMGYLQPATLAWVQTELANSPEDVILIASHHGPHSYGLRFRQADALALQNLVDAEVAARPSRKIRGIFGHWHVHQVVQKFDTLGGNFPGLLAPCMIDLRTAAYLDLYVMPNGELAWDKNEVHYWE